MKNIKLSSNLNIRDLGCISNIKPKKLIRSCSLDSLTGEDVKILKNEYHLSTIIDLRTNTEINEKSNVKINGTKYIKMPIFDESIVGITHEKNNNSNSKNINMQKLYYEMLHGKCLENISKIINYIIELSDSDYSILFHCTEGKDRTGIISAILLMILGIDKKTIIEDYLYTNVVNKPKSDIYYDKAISMGMNAQEAENIKKIFMAEKEYINTLFSIIDYEYKSVENFLEVGLNIDNNKLLNFKNKMVIQ